MKDAIFFKFQKAILPRYLDGLYLLFGIILFELFGYKSINQQTFLEVIKIGKNGPVLIGWKGKCIKGSSISYNGETWSEATRSKFSKKEVRSKK